jgi:hypothetical protein
MKVTAISGRIAAWILAAVLFGAAVLLVSPARADDRPKMRASHQHWVPPGHYVRDHRRHPHWRHDYGSRHYDSRYYRGRYYDSWPYDARSGRYYDSRARIWVSPYVLEWRSGPYSLRYGSDYRRYDSRYRYRYYDRDCDDDRRWDRDR